MKKLSKSVEKLFNKILSDKSDYIIEFTENHKCNFVITGMHFGDTITLIGRIFQVRKEHGAFGSDTVLIGLINGTIIAFENACYFTVKEQYIKELEDLFPDITNFNPEWKFDIQGEKSEIGFIIPSKHSEDYISPLKSIKLAIKEKISERLSC